MPPPPGGKPGPGPSAYETAKLFYLTGDLLKAEETARHGLQDDPKRCKALLKLLAEYAYLANHVDEFTPEQAKQFIELDKKITPDGIGKLTQKALDRYVEKPLNIARLRAQAGDAVGARAICADILKIYPKHPDTVAFLKSLDAPDAGSPDAGQSKHR
jgi:hypothetical protein